MMTPTPTHPQVYTQTPIDAGFSAIEIKRAVKLQPAGIWDAQNIKILLGVIHPSSYPSSRP